MALPLCLAADDAPPLPLVAAVALDRAPAPGASPEAPLRRDGESLVDPSVAFRVEAAVPLADARLALYDAQEALVPAEGLAEIGSAGSRLSLTPSLPLRPGSSYVLRLEGASEPQVRDLSGRRYRALTFTIRTSGEPAPDPPPPPKDRKKTKKKRR